MKLPAEWPGKGGRTVQLVATCTESGVKRAMSVFPSGAALQSAPSRRKTKRNPLGRGLDSDPANGVMLGASAITLASFCHRFQSEKLPAATVMRSSAAIAASIVL